MSTETLTDIHGLVDSAFEELDCIVGDTPHDGPRVALYTSHEGRKCLEGWLCRAHFDLYVQRYRPMIQACIDRHGYAECIGCGALCYSVDEWCKVYPL